MTTPETLISLLVGLGLVVLGLFVYGFRDLRRFSFTRAWAVGGVVFRESIRRRVLWVTPLAMLAVILLVRLQDPADEADAMRQSIKFCLFASGLVVVVISLVLACTNLPREIDNRVIFTIVTKPLTRLELLCGKVMGFMRVSGLVLVLMGVFSWCLLVFMEWRLMADVRTALAAPVQMSARQPYLERLSREGLLTADRIDTGDDLQIYYAPPLDARDESTEARFFYPNDYYAAVPFEVPEELIPLPGELSDLRARVLVRAPWRLMPWRPLLPGDPPLGIVNLENLPPPSPPYAAVQILDDRLYNVVSADSIEDNPFQLPATPDVPWSEAGVVRLGEQVTQRFLEAGLTGPVYLAMYGRGPAFLYGIKPDSMRIELLSPADEVVAVVEPALGESPRSSILVRTFIGNYGMGLRGPEEDAPPPVGTLAFRDTEAPLLDAEGRATFELLTGVERTGGLLDEASNTEFQVQVVNVSSGFASAPEVLRPETGLPLTFTVPENAVEGGDFDLRMQTLTPGHLVGVRGANVRHRLDRQPFAWNLSKGLFVLWLMSLLVIAGALAFSTFVSWPIALILTLVLLSGRWVATQLGGALDSGGMGRQVAQDLYGAGGDAAAKEAVRQGVDVLTASFTTLTSFLPDVGVYDVGSSIERGLVVEEGVMTSAAKVSFGFALPLLALGYIVLRNKEVAP